MAALLTHSLFDHMAGRGQAIVIAVSGGGDSMALLDLYRLTKLQNQHLPEPHVVTVDHGLRHSFAREASIVEAYCAKHNVPWRLVRWEGDKPRTGVMAAARLARYGLLADAAQGANSKNILTGHTLEDQNETATMRAVRGVPSQMESEVLFERRALIWRPLLCVSRDELRAHLAAHKIAFADDPTNVDMRFERARVRSQNSAPLADKAASVKGASVQQAGLAERAAHFISQNVRRENLCVVIDRPQTRKRDAEIFALRYLAASLGGFEYPAPTDIGEKLFELLGAGQNTIAFTAQRCVFTRVAAGIEIDVDPRHAARPQLQNRVAPFETFCALSKFPLANALAECLGAPHFILP